LFHLMNRPVLGSWGDSFFLFLTMPPHRVLLFLGLVTLLCTLGGSRGRKVALLALIAVTLTDQIGSAWLKPWTERVRPCFVLPDVRLLIPGQSHSGSFPSNHAANTFAVATVLFRLHPLAGALGLLVAALVSYSRIYVGVHYPSDALGGALLGTAIGLLVLRLDRLRGRAKWS
jgi:undecaprenyl-diphosphatase